MLNRSFSDTKFRSFIIVGLLIIILIISAIFSIVKGSVRLNIYDVINVIKYEVLGIGDYNLYGQGGIHDIVWEIRFPRTLLAIAIGISLSVSGVVMQAIVKNPLADPYILGISSGASLGATLSVLLGIGLAFGKNAIGISAFIGAMTPSLIVLVISNIGGRSNSIRLILGGMALSAISSAFSNFIIYMAHNAEGMKTIAFWLMGSLSGATWHSLNIFLPSVIIATIIFFTQSRILNMMLLGDEVSITLGTDLLKYRHVYLLITSFIIGFSVYCAGTIGFVGLVIPHIVRMIFGTNHKKLIPLSALIGAIFIIWSDLICRIILPNGELPIGILISLIGAPFFIILLLRKTYGFGGEK